LKKVYILSYSGSNISSNKNIKEENIKRNTRVGKFYKMKGDAVSDSGSKIL
jgi:hypothetical protein